MKNKIDFWIHSDLLEAMDHHISRGFVAGNRSEFIRLAIVEKLERLAMCAVKERLSGNE